MNERYSLGRYWSLVDRAVEEAGEKSYVRRIWAKDATLWKDQPEHQRIIRNALGWLTVAADMGGHAAELQAFADSVRKAGFSSACLLGMGGSSLCPEVCAITFGTKPGFLNLIVLDTTDPATISSAENRIDLMRTLFIVSSKSGGTIESASLHKYFYDKVARTNPDQAGKHFIAITDPGTVLEKLALDQGFLRLFLNPTDIGGRYSALSYFGLVPMALLGIDVPELLQRADRMALRCQSSAAASENPGLVLGVTLGALARERRDKVTFVLEPEIAGLGYWLEQLIAESTGKENVGILPVEGEPLGDPPFYGEDRVFVHLGLSGSQNPAADEKIRALENSGHPVLRWKLTDKLDLGAEFFRWEFATAVAGAVLGINAFDQPNVQESKDNTQRLIREYLDRGRLPEEAPALKEGDFSVFCASELANRLGLPKHSAANPFPTMKALETFFRMAQPGDYVAFLAYLEMSEQNHAALNELRKPVRDKLKAATTLGFGPRFLHSTGQLHKGGGNNGFFIQITAADQSDLSIPGEAYSFGTLKKAQALGDLQSLQMHGRRALRLHIDGNYSAGLKGLTGIMSDIL